MYNNSNDIIKMIFHIVRTQAGWIDYEAVYWAGFDSSFVGLVSKIRYIWWSRWEWILYIQKQCTF